MGNKKGLEKYKIFGQLKLTLFGLKRRRRRRRRRRRSQQRFIMACTRKQ